VTKKGKRKQTYHEHARKRERASERRELRRRMKEAQAPFKTKTKQTKFGGDNEEDG